MPSVDAVGAAQQSTATTTSLFATAPTTAPDQSVDYMSLLIAQLKNQDPTQPMDSTQMVAQTTQLGMLQELTGLHTSTDQAFALQMRGTAAALVGRTVIYNGTDGMPATGTVGSVSFAGQTPTVTVDGTAVPLDDVLGVTSAG